MDPVNPTIVWSKASLLCHLDTLGDEIRSQTPTLTELDCDLSDRAYLLGLQRITKVMVRIIFSDQPERRG